MISILGLNLNLDQNNPRQPQLATDVKSIVSLSATVPVPCARHVSHGPCHMRIRHAFCPTLHACCMHAASICACDESRRVYADLQPTTPTPLSPRSMGRESVVALRAPSYSPSLRGRWHRRAAHTNLQITGNWHAENALRAPSSSDRAPGVEVPPRSVMFLYHEEVSVGLLPTCVRPRCYATPAWVDDRRGVTCDGLRTAPVEGKKEDTNPEVMKKRTRCSHIFSALENQDILRWLNR